MTAVLFYNSTAALIDSMEFLDGCMGDAPHPKQQPSWFFIRLHVWGYSPLMIKLPELSLPWPRLINRQTYEQVHSCQHRKQSQDSRVVDGPQKRVRNVANAAAAVIAWPPKLLTVWNARPKLSLLNPGWYRTIRRNIQIPWGQFSSCFGENNSPAYMCSCQSSCGIFWWEPVLPRASRTVRWGQRARQNVRLVFRHVPCRNMSNTTYGSMESRAHVCQCV